MKGLRKSQPNWGSCWRRNDATGHLPVFPGIEHASEEIVDLLAMAAVESGVPAEKLRGHPRVHDHIKTIVSQSEW